MGIRGPHPKAETRRRNKKPAPRGTVTIKRPTKPKELTGEASKEWNRILPDLVQAGHLTKSDRGALIRYCRAWADWMELDGQIAATGRLVKGQKGELVRNPLWLLRRDAANEAMALGVQLGLSPSARRRMDIEHAEAPAAGDESETDDLAAYRERLKQAREAGNE